MVLSNLKDLNGNPITVTNIDTDGFKLAGLRGRYFGRLCKLIFTMQG